MRWRNRQSLSSEPALPVATDRAATSRGWSSTRSRRPSPTSRSSRSTRTGWRRLVPLDLVEGGPHEIRLRCTRAEFEQLDSAEESQFAPELGGYSAYGPGEVLTWPYYGLGGGLGFGVGTGVDGPSVITEDAEPPGEVSVRRGDPVYATDGPIGRVQGLVINPASHHVTHVLLQEGHLWGRKDVAIPIGSVKGPMRASR